jgi:hypothetical protein
MNSGGSKDGMVEPSSSAMRTDVYQLMGGDDMKAHVGHKVEVSGTLAPMATHKSKGGAGNGVQGTVQVSAVKMIATSCP